uniref:Uncharacterized protein n=1 Tax=Cannabis sativa TaxID=3483 RepID=A0A803Q865_CANSA
MEDLLAMLTATHSPKLEVANPPLVVVTPKGQDEEVVGSQEVALIEEEEEEVPQLDQKRKGVVSYSKPSKRPMPSRTPGPSTDSAILSEVEDFPAPCYPFDPCPS